MVRPALLGGICAARRTQLIGEIKSGVVSPSAEVLPASGRTSSLLFKTQSATLGRPLETIAKRTSGAASLVRLIEGGDRQAEEELCRRYHRGVSIIIERQGVNQDFVCDLCQETLVMVIRKIRGGEVRDPDCLSGYIKSVARNVAIAHFRKESKIASRAEISEEVLPVESPPSQFESLLQKEQARIVRKVIGEMKDRDQQILLRYFIAEQDKEEICHDLGLTSHDFNLVLHRARRRFKELVEKRHKELI